MRLRQLQTDTLLKQRLLFRMPTEADIKDIKHQNVISCKQLQRNPTQILFAYRQSDSKFTVLNFQSSCLINAQTFKVQQKPNKRITFIKIEQFLVKPKLYSVYIMVGYDDGVLQFYDFDQGYTKMKELKYEDDKSQVIDVHLDNQTLNVLRRRTLQMYKIKQGLVFYLQQNLILGFQAATFLVGKKYLYLASRTQAQVWDRNFKCLFKVNSLGVRVFYEPPQAQSQFVILGCDDDTLTLLHFGSKSRQVYSGFKSFVVGIFRNSQGLWAVSMDGRAVCLELEKEGEEPGTNTLCLNGQQCKLHSEGVVWVTGVGNMVVLYDYDDYVNIYEPNLSIKFSDLKSREI